MINKFSDRGLGKFQPQRSDAASTYGNINQLNEQAYQSVNQKIAGLAQQTHAIAQNFGEQDAQIRGQEDAQKEFAAYTDAKNKQSELEKLVLQGTKRDVIENNVPASIVVSPNALKYPDDKALSTNVNLDEPILDENGNEIDINNDTVVDGEAISQEETDAAIDSTYEQMGGEDAEYTQSAETIVAQQELERQKEIVKAFEVHGRKPSFNLYDIQHQATAEKLKATDLNNTYQNAMNKVYELYKNDPVQYAAASKEVAKKILETTPPQMKGDVSQTMRQFDIAMADKVAVNVENARVEQVETKTTNNINTAIEQGSKIAYNGGPPELVKTYLDTIQQQLLIKFDESVKAGNPDGATYSKGMVAAAKTLKSQSLEGNFNRLIGYGDTPNATKDINKRLSDGYAEIQRFKNEFNQKEGESLAEYNKRTDGFNQKEVTAMVSSMEAKLKSIQTTYNKGVKADLKTYTNNTKEAYKMMYKGIKPNNIDDLKIQAAKYGDSDNFNSALSTMNYLQRLNETPIAFQDEELKEIKKDAYSVDGKGVSVAGADLMAVMNKQFKENKALAKSDPNQLEINQGTMGYKDISKSEDINEILGQIGLRTKNIVNMETQYNWSGKSVLSENETMAMANLLSSDPVGAPQVIAAVTQVAGQTEANKIFKSMYPKNSNGIVYSAIISSKKPKVAQQINAGIDMLRNDAKLESDAKTEYNDFMTGKNGIVIDRLGTSAPGIREAVQGYYVNMPQKDMDKAVEAVTNGIDNGIIVPKQGWDYGDTFNKIKDTLTNITFKETKMVLPEEGESTATEYTPSSFDNSRELKSRLNGEPVWGFDELRKNINDYQLVTVSSQGYAFKNKETGAYLTTNKMLDGRKQKLVYTFQNRDLE